jgi:hypothetical protein
MEHPADPLLRRSLQNAFSRSSPTAGLAGEILQKAETARQIGSLEGLPIWLWLLGLVASSAIAAGS